MGHLHIKVTVKIVKNNMREIASFQNGVNIVGLPEIVIVMEEKVLEKNSFQLGSYRGKEKVREQSEIKFLKTVL